MLRSIAQLRLSSELGPFEDKQPEFFSSEERIVWDPDPGQHQWTCQNRLENHVFAFVTSNTPFSMNSWLFPRIIQHNTFPTTKNNIKILEIQKVMIFWRKNIFCKTKIFFTFCDFSSQLCFLQKTFLFNEKSQNVKKNIFILKYFFKIS